MRLLRTLLIVVFFLLSVTVQAGNLQPGFVELKKVREQSLRYQQEHQAFLDRKERAFNVLNQKLRRFQRKLTDLKNNRSNYSPQNFKARRLVLSRKIVTLKRRKKRLEYLLSDKESIVQKQFLRTVRRKIKPLAQEQGLNVVLNYSAHNTNFRVLWASPERNLTESLLETIDEP